MPSSQPSSSAAGTACAIACLTLAANLILGYHPFAEDGGLYLAAVQHHVDPALFPHSQQLVLSHTRWSVYAPMLAALTALTHIPLAWTALTVQILSIAFTLYAALTVARCATTNALARWGSVSLFALSLSLPIAGTSLYIADPYLTPRSLSTPLLLLAFAALCRNRTRVALACIMLAAGLHPLMTIWMLLPLALYAAIQHPRSAKVAAPALCLAHLTFAAMLYLFSPKEDTIAHQLAASRSYWFLPQWQWYEVFGAIAPILILLALFFWKPQHPTLTTSGRRLALSMAIAGTVALITGFLFASNSAGPLLLARLQPLRTLHALYSIFLILFGADLANHILRSVLWRWCIATVVIAGTLFAVQRNIYPNSQHIEAPWIPPANQWVQAFAWAKDNTPRDALFALDAHYITAPGEDAQGFRAAAQRSALADFSKDGGAASVTPAIRNQWLIGQSAQTDLNKIDDHARMKRLLALGVTWIVLPTSAHTGFICPYINSQVKVCKLP